MTPDPHLALPLDERIRLAEQAVIERDARVRGLSHDLSARWHGHRLPGMAQGAGAGLLAALGSWFVRRAFAARPALRHRAGNARLDLLLQFLPLLLPVLPARLQRWVKPSRLMLGLALAAPLFAAWQTKREQAREQAREAAAERALIQQVLREQRDPSPASQALDAQPDVDAAEQAHQVPPPRPRPERSRVHA